MRTIFFLVRKEFRQIFRDPVLVFQLMAVPFIQVILITSAATFDVRDVPTLFHVVNYYPICPLGTKLLPDHSPCHQTAGVGCYQSGCLGAAGLARAAVQGRLFDRGRDAIDYVVANSHWTRRRLEADGYCVDDVIWNGVPRRPARPSRPRLTVASAALMPRERYIPIRGARRPPTGDPFMLRVPFLGPIPGALLGLVLTLFGQRLDKSARIEPTARKRTFGGAPRLWRRGAAALDEDAQQNAVQEHRKHQSGNPYARRQAEFHRVSSNVQTAGAPSDSYAST